MKAYCLYYMDDGSSHLSAVFWNKKNAEKAGESLYEPEVEEMQISDSCDLRPELLTVHSLRAIFGSYGFAVLKELYASEVFEEYKIPMEDCHFHISRAQGGPGVPFAHDLGCWNVIALHERLKVEDTWSGICMIINDSDLLCPQTIRKN